MIQVCGRKRRISNSPRSARKNKFHSFEEFCRKCKFPEFLIEGISLAYLVSRVEKYCKQEWELKCETDKVADASTENDTDDEEEILPSKTVHPKKLFNKKKDCSNESEAESKITAEELDSLFSFRRGIDLRKFLEEFEAYRRVGGCEESGILDFPPEKETEKHKLMPSSKEIDEKRELLKKLFADLFDGRNAIKYLIQREVPTTIKRRKLFDYERCEAISLENVKSFLLTLSDDSIEKPDPTAVWFKTNYSDLKNELADHLAKLYNKYIFNSELTTKMTIIWHNERSSSAAECLHLINSERKTARVILYEKYLVKPAFLRDALLHEMAHAAAWTLKGLNGKDGYVGHCPGWYYWTEKAMEKLPYLPPIIVNHTYHKEIEKMRKNENSMV